MARPDSPRNSQPKSPLLTLLEALIQPNLLGISDAKTPPPPRPVKFPLNCPFPASRAQAIEMPWQVISRQPSATALHGRFALG